MNAHVLTKAELQAWVDMLSDDEERRAMQAKLDTDPARTVRASSVNSGAPAYNVPDVRSKKQCKRLSMSLWRKAY
jgi:anti-sigma factor RsiW